MSMDGDSVGSLEESSLVSCLIHTTVINYVTDLKKKKKKKKETLENEQQVSLNRNAVLVI